MSLLYVTSFSKNLYEHSGKRLIESYLKCNIQDPLLICTDDFEYLSPNNKIKSKYIGDEKYLIDWEKANKDIIPNKYGGESTISLKKLQNDIKKYKHKHVTDKNRENSRHQFMNYRVKNFFMKIVSLHYALAKYQTDYDILVWIDCDCYFVDNISNLYISNIFDKKYGVIYFEGKNRKLVNNGYETGFIAFHKNYDGFELLQRIITCYEDGSFKKYKGWYDGFVIKMICEESTDILKYDMADKINNGNVMNYDNPIFDYIKHEKGTHIKNKVI